MIRLKIGGARDRSSAAASLRPSASSRERKSCRARCNRQHLRQSNVCRSHRSSYRNFSHRGGSRKSVTRQLRYSLMVASRFASAAESRPDGAGSSPNLKPRAKCRLWPAPKRPARQARATSPCGFWANPCRIPGNAGIENMGAIPTNRGDFRDVRVVPWKTVPGFRPASRACCAAHTCLLQGRPCLSIPMLYI